MPMKMKSAITCFLLIAFVTSPTFAYLNTHFDKGVNIRSNNEGGFAMIKTRTPFQSSKIQSNDPYGGGRANTLISLALPGVGLYNVNRNPISFVFLPICYGSVGYGLIKLKQGKAEYANYSGERDPSLHEPLITNANTLNKEGKFYLGVGLAAWVVQAGVTYIYGGYNDVYRKRDAGWKNKISLSSAGYDFKNNMATVGVAVKF